MEGRLGSSSDPQAHTQLLAIRVSSPRVSPSSGGHFLARPLTKLFYVQNGSVRSQPSQLHLDGNWLRRVGQSHSRRIGPAGAPSERTRIRGAALRAPPLQAGKVPRPPWSLPFASEHTPGKAARVSAQPGQSLPFAGGRWAGRGRGLLGGQRRRRSGGKSRLPDGAAQPRAPSASDGCGGGDGDRGAAAAAVETDTPPGGGSSPPALKAPRSFPRSRDAKRAPH